MERVAELLGGWAEVRAMASEDVLRWRAAGHLHDVLRDADPDELRVGLPEDLAGMPDPVLHGPVAALRLRAEGVADEALLAAVAWHTLGHPELDTLGRALYAADFLEPGRDFRNPWRAGLRARMPGALNEVVAEVLAARIGHQVEEGGPLRPETVAFWNILVDPD